LLVIVQSTGEVEPVWASFIAADDDRRPGLRRGALAVVVAIALMGTATAALLRSARL
jgi:hypothetical protein